MNWLDIILLVILALSVIWGLRTDLIGGMFTGLGVFVGWVLAGQLADEIGAIFDASLNSDTLVTVLSYIIIIIVSVVIIRSIGKIVKPILIVGTLGTVGLGAKLGGLALGFIIGLALGGILITGLARLAYNFTLPTPSINVPGITGTIAGGQASSVSKALKNATLPFVDSKKEIVETALTESTVVPIYMKVRDILPGNALAFIPDDFGAALDILQSELDKN